MSDILHPGWSCCNGRQHYCNVRTQIAMDAEAPAFYRRALYMGSNMQPGVHGFLPCADFASATAGTARCYAGFEMLSEFLNY